jgi:DNA-binding MarR family transcriptional regulator
VPNENGDWWDAWRGVLFATGKILQAAEPQMIRESGMTLVWFDVLGRLESAPAGRLRIQELQERSLFTRSGMTRIVDRMEAAGLVRREAVPGDRRGVYVVLTDEGRRRHVEALADHSRVIEREFRWRLTPAQHTSVAAALYQFWHDGPAASPSSDT